MKKTVVLLYTLTASLLFSQDTPADLGAIWCLGDSITQGNADRDPNGTPRKELYDILKKEGYTFSFTGHHQPNPEGLPDAEE